MSHPRLKLFLCLSIVFFLFAIVGTLAHECGHYLVARCLGYQATISYAATMYNCSYRIPPYHSFLIATGGPLQTMFTGSLGVWLLWRQRSKMVKAEQLTTRQWLLVFISLFWLRQPTNLAVWLAGYAASGSWSVRRDELRLAAYLHLPLWSVINITAFAGVLVFGFVFFRFIPGAKRLVFLLSGIMGGILGYVFWIGWAGKYILP